MQSISVYAPTHMDPMDSYGLIACELVRHLSRQGFLVNAIAMGNPRHPSQDDELKSYTSQPIIPTAGGILLGYPTQFHHYGALANMKPKIAVTMFESTKLPQGWKETLNACDAVIVPSYFCNEIFTNSGVTAPIYVFPLGINDVYQPEYRIAREPYTFLTFMDRGRRKGGLLALEAFVNEFGDSLEAKLIIKRRPLKDKANLILTNPNIEVINEDYTEDEMYKLYLRCHCLINPNKGEGFGLLPREFAATGGISLSTDWGATGEDLQQWGWPIGSEEEPALWEGIEQFKGQDLGMWAAPDLKHLQRQMKMVFRKRTRRAALPLLQSK